MALDSTRILELRRRLQTDPSSIAFAQLAEELRRAGSNSEAIDVCRAGLSRHPGYLSARVTLGRALLDLDQLDEAREELLLVVGRASDNLAAIRGLAEIHQRRGELAEALVYYRRALELARHDPDLEETVERMEKHVAPTAPAEPQASIEELFDFDRLVEQLGAEAPPGVVALDALTSVPPPTMAAATGGDPLDAPLQDDAFARLETELRELEATVPQAPDHASAEDIEVLAELEDWLSALRSSR